MPRKVQPIIPNAKLHEINHKSKIQDIITALEYLRNESRKQGNDDITELIDSTFQVCLNAFCIIKRYELGQMIIKMNSH